MNVFICSCVPKVTVSGKPALIIIVFYIERFRRTNEKQASLYIHVMYTETKKEYKKSCHF